MSIPFWPSDLPQRVSRNGFGETFRDGRLRTAMEAGPPKMRRRFSSAVRPIQASIEVTVDGKARLERFWSEEAAGGTLPFLMPDQTLDGLALTDGDGIQLLDDQGRPLVNTNWWLAMFGDSAPSVQNMGWIWYRVSFPLMVLP
ncbi:hypothetical protein [Methylobacterium sp. sgz302541]|uniref:hypothetical protein n=1 Tax=unclassified Methylobacterium TaxID=2615210 RepID=UPI003D326E16